MQLCPGFAKMNRLLILLSSLLLLVVTVRAEDYSIENSISQDWQIYDGYHFFTTNIDVAPVTPVQVRVNGATVQGNGLSLLGALVATQTKNTLAFVLNSTSVTDATITFSNYMPTRATISVLHTTAAMTSSKPLFNFESLHLTNGVSFTVQDTVATWSGGQSGWLIEHGSQSGPFEVAHSSALFVLSGIVKGAQGLLNLASSSGVSVSDKSALTLDYLTCNPCNKASIAVSENVNVADNSLLRLSQLETSKSVLAIASPIGVSSGSTFLLSFVKAGSGALFESLQAAITLSGTSTMTYQSLNVPSTGVASPTEVPTRDSSSHVYGQSNKIAGAVIAVLSAYQAKGLNVDIILKSDGKSITGNTCTRATCVAANTDGVPTASSCPCQCSVGSSRPSCLVMNDPLQFFIDNGASQCWVPHCLKCDPTNPSSCTQCQPNYVVQGGACATPPSCINFQCASCAYIDGKYVCTSCPSGYILNSQRHCVRQSSGANFGHVTPTAFVTLLASAVAAHLI